MFYEHDGRLSFTLYRLVIRQYHLRVKHFKSLKTRKSANALLLRLQPYVDPGRGIQGPCFWSTLARLDQLMSYLPINVAYQKNQKN